MNQPGPMNPEQRSPEPADTPETTGQLKNAAGTVASETRDAARSVAQTAKEQARRVGDTVKDQTTHVATQARSALRQQAESAKSGLAQTLDQAAVQVRQKANEANRNDLGLRIAQPLERSADYLRQTPVEDMPADLSHTIAANPLRSVVVAFGIGWILGRMLKH